MNFLNFRNLWLSAAFLVLVPSSYAKEILLGEAVKEQKPLSVKEILKQPEKYNDKEITIEGKIVKVCKVRGCWADFSSGDSQLRVKVKDGVIEIPLYAIGKKAYASGTLKTFTMSKEQTIAYLEHMAKDAGEEFDPKTVTAGMVRYQLQSNAIKIL